MFSWRITLSKSEYSQWATENTCTVRATMWATCYLVSSSKRHVHHAEHAEGKTRHGSFREEDTVQVVEVERGCTWNTDQVEDIVTTFLMKTMQGRTVKWERLLNSRKCQQRQDGRRTGSEHLWWADQWWTLGLYKTWLRLQQTKSVAGHREFSQDELTHEDCQESTFCEASRQSHFDER